jgi:hypothetical protein
MSKGANNMTVNNAGIAIDMINTEVGMFITSKFQISDHSPSLPTLSSVFTRQ